MLYEIQYTLTDQRATHHNRVELEGGETFDINIFWSHLGQTQMRGIRGAEVISVEPRPHGTAHKLTVTVRTGGR